MSRRLLWVGVFVLGAVGASVVLWTLRGLEEIPLEIAEGDVEPIRRQGHLDSVRFAVAPVMTPEGTAQSFEPVARRLGRLIGRPVRLVQRRNYQEVNELLRAGTIHLALVCPGAYFQALRDGIDLDVLAVPYYDAGPVYRSYIIVRADSQIEAMAELRGRPFAFADPLSLSGHFYPMEWAHENGFDPHLFFSSASFTYSHTENIEAVLNETVEGAAVDSLVYDLEVRRRPALRSRLRIVHRSQPMGATPIVAPRKIDSGLREALRAAFPRIAETEEGSLALESLGVLRFAEPPRGLHDRDLARFDALMRHLEGER